MAEETMQPTVPTQEKPTLGERSRAFLKRNAYDVGAGFLATASIPFQKWAEFTVPPSAISSRLMYDAIYNTGDFAEAIIFGSIAHMGLRWFSPEMPAWLRVGVASSISAELIVGLETQKFRYPLSLVTGTPDVGDITYGLMGVGAYLLIGGLAEASIHATKKVVGKYQARRAARTQPLG